MTKEVEDIIRNKAFIELNSAERDLVGEWAQNEDEYTNLQWFLAGTVTSMAEGKIIASPGLKKGVMEHLTESQRKKGFWLNSVGVFMLPEGRKTYQKPAFQLGVAAAAVLGFLFFFNNGMNDDDLALNDVKVEETLIIEDSVEQPLEESSKMIEVDEESVFEKGLDATNEFIVPTEDLVVDQRSEDGPAGMIDELNEEYSYNEMAPPGIVEMDAVEDEEEVSEILDPGNIGYVTSNDESQIAVEKSSATESLKSGEGVVLNDTDEVLSLNKRDRNKNKAFRNIVEKKETAARDDLYEEAPVMDKDVDNREAEDAGTGGYLGASEWIAPKSLHINKTKELNQLFHIEK